MELWDLLCSHKEGNLSFADSVSLFFKIYPEKQRTLATFFETEDQISWKKLNTSLTEKYEQLDANRQKNELIRFTPLTHRNAGVNVEILPEELRTEHGRLGPIIRKMSRLHARLDLISTDEDRYHVAKEIVELATERRAIWTAIDDFIDNGKVSTTPESVKRLPVDKNLTKDYVAEDKLRKLRSNRSKWKKMPHRKADYDRVCKEIEEIEGKRYV